MGERITGEVLKNRLAVWDKAVSSVALAFVLLLAGCNKTQESQALPAQKASDETDNMVWVSPKAQEELLVQPVHAKPLREEMIVQGRIQYNPDGFVKLSSPLVGLVKTVRGKLGERVSTGQVILTIESADIGRAYADFTEAESDLQLARRSFGLAADLYNVKAIPKKDFEQAENELRRSQAEYQRARARLLALRVPESELNKPRRQRQITDRFDVKSPLSGVIVEKNVTVGQLIDTNVILYAIADLDVLQAVGEIYERDLPLMKPGLAASVMVEPFPGDRFPAVVVYVGDIIDPTTRTVKIRCDVRNLAHKLKLDMFARIHIEVESQPTVLALPREAVIRFGDKAFVFVQHTPEEYERREVVTGPIVGDLIEIREGLQSGERVVVKGGLLLEGALERKVS